jgi:hypothetical protein
VTRSGPLHAAGDLEAMGRAWWSANMRSPISEVKVITVAGDGGLRFHWRDHEEGGTYHVPLWRIYRDVPHVMGRPAASPEGGPTGHLDELEPPSSTIGEGWRPDRDSASVANGAPSLRGDDIETEGH